MVVFITSATVYSLFGKKMQLDLMPWDTGVDHLISGWAFSHKVCHYEASRVQ